MTNGYTKRLRHGLGLQQPTGWWTNAFKYDLARRLTNVASVSGNFSYAYEPGAGSLVRKLTLPNTSFITNAYDALARMLSTTLKNSSHSTLNSNGYSYNAGHQRTEQTFNSGSTYDYSYDPIGQLKVADSATASEDRGYAYDPAWNLNYRTNNTTLQTFTVNGKNELTNSVGTACKYDSNGNLTNNGTLYYGYDDENRLGEAWSTAAINPNSWWWTVYVYDGQSRLRIAKEYHWEAWPEGPEGPGDGGGSWVLTTEKRYVYDGNLVLQERAWDGADFSPTVSYTRGSDLSGTQEGAGGIGGLLARSHGYSSGNWSTHNFYHADGNGNVTYLVDSSQALAASYRYDPYGRLTSSSGSLAGANTYRFSSKEIHGRTGFYYYGYRWYAPEMQRWVNRDPFGEDGGINLYAHVENDLVNMVDPLGLWAYFQPSTWFDGKGYQPGPWEDLNGQAAQATLDGIIPFGDPFMNNGGYDPCDKALTWSRTLGEFSRDVYIGSRAWRVIGPYDTRGLPKYVGRIRQYVRYDRAHHGKPPGWDGKLFGGK